MKLGDDATICPDAAQLRRRTIPAQLALRARETPHAVAHRAKIRGIYCERSWADLRGRVGAFAFAVRALDFVKGDRVAIMGDCCEAWTIADLGTQCAGGISYGIYPTASAAEVKFQVDHGGAVVFVAENQEYVDKILAIEAELPALRWIVVIDTTGMFAYRHPKLIAFDALLEAGREEASRPGAFEDLIRNVRPSDPAFMVYTSGTTGNPKGVVVGHGKHLAAASVFISHYPSLGSDPHRAVAFLPLGHVMGRISTITLPLLGHMVPHYGESLEDVPRTLFEVAPTFLFTVPRYLQKYAAAVLVAIENTTPLKRALYNLAFTFGRHHATRRWGGRARRWDGLVYGAAYLLAFRPILNKMGFDQLRLVIIGGAAAGRELTAVWQIWGVNVIEVFGQSETAGAMISGQHSPFPLPGHVGVPPTGWDVRLGEDGEILVRAADLFEGYWRDPAATAETVDSDGWLHTGDIGAWKNGQLHIVDRARDIIVTAGGKSVSPTAIESQIRASPFVSEAVVFGDGRKYLTALIEIEFDTVSDWAKRRNVAYAGFTSLTNAPETVALIGREIATANRNLARVEQIKAFRIIPKVLDPEEEGEPITPTRKIKRRFMYQKYRELVESMYSHDEEDRLRSAVGQAIDAIPAELNSRTA